MVWIYQEKERERVVSFCCQKSNLKERYFCKRRSFKWRVLAVLEEAIMRKSAGIALLVGMTFEN